MLKQRLIVGLLLAALFVALLLLDSYASGGWPETPWSTPPGFFLAIVSVLVVPLGLIEMRSLLARENVTISLSVTFFAAILCMLWPWFEQIGESVQQRHEQIVAQQATATNPAAFAERLKNIESSPWFPMGRWFRTVKPHYLVPTILTLSLVAAMALQARGHRVDGTMANAGGTLLAIVYLGVLPGFYLPICMTHSAWVVLAIVGVVKAADIGAYAIGRMIGRHPLIPWLSPKKTIEGFFGGLLLASLFAASIAAVIKLNGASPSLESVTMPVVLLGGFFSGTLLGAVGQLGDLLESLLKRDAGVKDSGKVPGFGGVLDILDSPLLAAPVAYWLLKLVLRT